MANRTRKLAQRPKYLRKGGASTRASGQSIWDMLRGVENQSPQKVKMRQNSGRRDAGG